MFTRQRYAEELSDLNNPTKKSGPAQPYAVVPISPAQAQLGAAAAAVGPALVEENLKQAGVLTTPLPKGAMSYFSDNISQDKWCHRCLCQ